MMYTILMRSHLVEQRYKNYICFHFYLQQLWNPWMINKLVANFSAEKLEILVIFKTNI